MYIIQHFVAHRPAANYAFMRRLSAYDISVLVERLSSSVPAQQQSVTVLSCRTLHKHRTPVLKIYLEHVPVADMFDDGFHTFRSRVKQYAASL